MVKIDPSILEKLAPIAEDIKTSGKLVENADWSTQASHLENGKDLPYWLIRRGSKSAEVQGALTEATRKGTAQIATDSAIAERAIKGLTTDQDKTDFYTLVMMGRKEQLEFDENTLTGWNISDEVKRAYEGYMYDSRKAHVAATLIDHDIKAKQGWKTNKLGDTAKEVNPSQLSEKFSHMAILEPDTGELLSAKNSSIESIKSKYLDKGYKLYMLHPDDFTRNGDEWTHYLSKDPDELSELTQWTLPYIKGGSNAYTPDTHFVKIGRDLWDKEGGRLFHGFPKTLKADENVRRLEKYAEEVNRVSQMWKDTQGDLVELQRLLDEANFQEFKVTAATDVKELMRSKENPNGLIDPEYKATVLRNNEKYVYEDGAMSMERLEDYDRAKSEQLLVRGSYYRSRGDEILTNLNEDFGHVVDPFTMWQRNIEQAAQNNTLNRLMVDYGEWFKEQYAPVIDTKGGRYNINRMSGAEVIATADIKAPNSYYNSMAVAAKRAQMTYANVLNIPTKLDVMINKAITEMFHMLPRRWWDNKAMDKLLRWKPADWANAIIYRNYLGMFNAKQFILQGPFQMANTWALAGPVKGTQALVSLPAIIAGHFFKNTPVVKQIPKLLAAVGGITPKQYDQFMKFMDDYATFKQFSKRPELTQNMENWLQTHSQVDLIFAQAGNNLAQLYADLAAFLIDGGKNMRNICRLSDDFMLNLNRVNTSATQRSFIGRFAATFTSYPIAVYEHLFGDHLTKMQKARFAALQIGLAGIGGVVGRDLITNMYDFAERNFPGIDPDVRAIVIEGLMTDYFEQLGIDVSEGPDLLGMFTQMSALIPFMSEIFGVAPELPIANVGTVLIDNYNAAREIISPTTGVRDLLAWAEYTGKQRGVASSVKNFARYTYAQNARAFIDRHGMVLRRNPSQLQVFAQLLGFGPVEQKHAYRAVKRENEHRAAVRQAFEDRMLQPITYYVNYRDTGAGKTELLESRTDEYGVVIGNVEQASRQFMAYVREFYPHMEEYAQSLITNAMNAGASAENRKTKVQRKYYEEDINRSKR